MAVPKAGAKIRASDWTTVFPVDTDGWTGYTPVVTQSNTPTLTVEYASWTKVGRWVTVQLSVSITSAGTASNAIVVTLPSAAGTPVGFRVLGTAYVYDASAAIWYGGMAQYNTATTFNMVQAGNGSPVGVAAMTAALASGDKISGVLTYQVSS